MFAAKEDVESMMNVSLLRMLLRNKKRFFAVV